MLPIEEAIIEKLRGGPCCFDEVVSHFPNSSWGKIFVAVDGMSRDGRVLLRQVGYSTYQLSLGPKFAYSSSTSSRGGGRDDNDSSGDLTREGRRANGSLPLCASEPNIGRAVSEMERI